MNKRNYINNMGVSTLSDTEEKALSLFISKNKILVDGLSKKQVHNTFKGTIIFSSARLSAAFSNQVS